MGWRRVAAEEELMARPQHDCPNNGYALGGDDEQEGAQLIEDVIRLMEGATTTPPRFPHRHTMVGCRETSGETHLISSKQASKQASKFQMPDALRRACA
jgi:hypothetical protein